MFSVFSRFLECNPDAKKTAHIYMHTWPIYPEGMNLSALAKILGIQQYIKITDEFHRFVGLSEQDLAEFYSCADVFLNLARGEGFGIPILEAEACGVPVIATKFSSMIELVEGHGWLIPPVTLDMTPLLSYQALANVDDAAAALSEAYNKPDLAKKHGLESCRFAQDYDYETKIIPKWERLLMDVHENLKEQSFQKPNIELKAKP